MPPPYQLIISVFALIFCLLLGLPSHSAQIPPYMTTPHPHHDHEEPGYPLHGAAYRNYTAKVLIIPSGAIYSLPRVAIQPQRLCIRAERPACIQRVFDSDWYYPTRLSTPLSLSHWTLSALGALRGRYPK